MVQGAGMTCVKYLMIIFNVLFLLAGLVLLVFGSIAQFQSSKIGYVNSAAVLVIVIGGVIFLLAFFGCCGAMKENRCLLITFGIFMIIVLVLCVAAIIVALVFRNQVNEVWKQPLVDSLDEFDPTKETSYLVVWPQVQLDGKCCGVNNASDWLVRNSYYKSKNAYPGSCCGNTTVTSTCKPVTYTDGCLDVIVHRMEQSLLIVGGIIGGVAALQVLGILFAFCLADAIHKGYKTV